MTEPLANVTTSDTFSTWLTRTNQLIESLRTKVVSITDALTGNVSVNGTISSTILEANTGKFNSSVTIANGTVWHSLNQGANSGLDSDLLDGQHGSYYTNIPGRLGFTPLNATAYTASDVLSKILTVDGANSTLDADLLDGQHGSYYLAATNLTGTIPSARISGDYNFANIAANAVAAATVTANVGTITTLNLNVLAGNAANQFASNSHTHAFSAITGRPTTISGYGITDVGTAGLLPIMTAAEFRNNTSNKVLVTDKVWESAGLVSLTDQATIAFDMSTFINATVTLGASRIFGNPTNAKVGQSGFIRIVQDGGGSRLATFSSNWKFAGGVDPTLSTTPGAWDLLYYQVIATDFIYGSLVLNVS